ncbi:WXG100 family type VII secretion target [Nocardia abscessus]|uniref:WXG100 family type VII secretion target n=1 Tax=Nocardia TaxID=1817 RepID=UPI0018933262|nr:MULTISPECIES: WXG100 family type VII secretion target [Nocardia]MBF6218074.1 WXG100 family type VII secretion target [Nocardia abscessus]MDE1670557.1 WXG100 family type VII secretion target [Nocardia gipuzkoensis]
MHSNPEQMHAAADRISARANEFWDDVEALRKEADALMSADWTGEAADSHATMWTEWVDSARKVAAALSEDAALIHQAADRYVKTDNSNAGDLTYVQFNLGNP